MSYVSGFLLAVPEEKKQAYKEMTEKVWPLFKEYGCLSVQENWGVDTPEGTVTSFPMAVKREKGEVVVFSWMIWPDKATADKGFERMMSDPRMQEITEMPFDGMRMMWGGFEPLVTLTAD